MTSDPFLSRLGSLACFYDDAPTLNSSLSRLLLSQLDDCSNSGVNKLKKKLFNTVMSLSVDVSSPELLRALGPGVTLLSPFHLSQFSPDALKDTLMSLGSEVKWGLTQAKTLANKLLQGKQVREVLLLSICLSLIVLREEAIQAWGPVSGLNESQVLQLGCVSQGFNLTELASLPFSSLDTLETLSRCSWTQPQGGCVERINETLGELGAVELVGLDQFICGLNTEETGQLNTDAFREAVQSVGEVQCPLAVTELLKQRAVAPFLLPPLSFSLCFISLFSSWFEFVEFLSLSPSAFSFLSPTSVPLIPPDRLAALSTSQLKALGPDNAAMVTNAQWAVLGVAQRAALGNALGVAYDRVAYDRTEPTTNPLRNLPQLSGE
ncbi:unnamed protein product [Oncorhynchus mykiss]|uniref:Stereocilin n=1 Tax=Oncorhynchus mykiss TaxID=8022 RepID=A0A060Y9N1_ONCMY|nr:unnamed protein product [Oncorhynchus mykiss]